MHVLVIQINVNLKSLFIDRVYQQWNFVKTHQGVNFCHETVNNTAVFRVMFNCGFVFTLQNADTSDLDRLSVLNYSGMIHNAVYVCTE